MNIQEIDRILDDSLEYQNSGNVSVAEAGYLQVLSAHPNNSEALQMLGSLKIFLEDHVSGQKYLRKAISLDNKDPLSHLNLAVSLFKSNDFQDAYYHAEKAVDLAPGHAAMWKQLAFCSEMINNYTKMISAHEKVLTLDSSYHLSRIKLAIGHLKLGDLGHAQQALNTLSTLPNIPDNILLDAIEFSLSHKLWTTCITLCKSWLDKTENDQVRQKLSQAYLENGNIPEALKVFKPLLSNTNDEPERFEQYGRMCLISQNFNEAEENLLIACKLLPNSAEVAFGLARLFTFKGDIEKATKECKRAIKLNSGHVPAYIQLTTLLSGKVDDISLDKMENLLDNQELSEEQRATLAISIGDIYDKKQDVDKAFHYYKRGNESNYTVNLPMGEVYNSPMHSKLIQSLIDEITPLYNPNKMETKYQPIFIVGMPRSGTTLLESLLATNDDVHGCGELLAGSHVLQEYLLQRKNNHTYTIEKFINERGPHWRKVFEELFANEKGATTVVDKLPINFLSIGLLGQLFPHAKFVHIYRNPKDTALSIYRHAFPRAYDFSHRLEDIGDYMKHYQMMMDHWRANLDKDSFSEVSYESLTDNTAEVTQELFNNLGLEWNKDVMSFHKKKRNIATFSSVQVRQPINKQSVASHIRYEKFLTQFSKAYT